MLASLPTDNLGSTPQLEWWQRRLKPEGVPPDACVEISTTWLKGQIAAQQPFHYMIQITENERAEAIALTPEKPSQRVFCHS